MQFRRLSNTLESIARGILKPLPVPRPRVTLMTPFIRAPES